MSMCSAWTRDRLEWYHLERHRFRANTSAFLSTSNCHRLLTLCSRVRLAEVQGCPASSQTRCSAEVCLCSGRWGGRGCQTPGCQSGRSGWSQTPDVNGSYSAGLDLSAWKRTVWTCKNSGQTQLTQTCKMQNSCLIRSLLCLLSSHPLPHIEVQLIEFIVLHDNGCFSVKSVSYGNYEKYQTWFYTVVFCEIKINK